MAAIQRSDSLGLLAEAVTRPLAPVQKLGAHPHERIIGLDDLSRLVIPFESTTA